MKREIIFSILTIFLVFSIAGCKEKSGDAAAAPVAEKPPVAVEVETASARDLVEEIAVTGSLEPKFAADVKSQIPGLFREVYVTDWVKVKKGDPLAKIDIPETDAAVRRAEAAVAAARAELARSESAGAAADRELARMNQLVEQGLATRQALDTAKTEAEASQARTGAVRAQIHAAEEETKQARSRLGKGLIVAPMDGVVSLRAVNVGDLASDAAAAKPIFRIVDNRTLNLTVTVPPAVSARIAVGQILEFTVDLYPGEIFHGTVMFINPEYNPGDRSLKVVAEVANEPEVLKGGLFAKGRIITAQRSGVLQVPRTALVGWDTAARQAGVLVVTGTTARLRKVDTGKVAAEFVEIVQGLAEGESFVVRGGFTVKDGDRIVVTGGGARS